MKPLPIAYAAGRTHRQLGGLIIDNPFIHSLTPRLFDSWTAGYRAAKRSETTQALANVRASIAGLNETNEK